MANDVTDQCKAPDCRTIVEGTFSFCAIRTFLHPWADHDMLMKRSDIKCSVGNCAKARHLPRGAKEYLSGCELRMYLFPKNNHGQSSDRVLSRLNMRSKQLLQAEDPGIHLLSRAYVPGERVR